MGDWGAPMLITTSGVVTEPEVIVRQGDQFDRIVLEEDIVLDQLIRNYTVVVDKDKVVAYGSAIGRKEITLWDDQQIAVGDFQGKLIIQSYGRDPFALRYRQSVKNITMFDFASPVMYNQQVQGVL